MMEHVVRRRARCLDAEAAHHCDSFISNCM